MDEQFIPFNLVVWSLFQNWRDENWFSGHACIQEKDNIQSQRGWFRADAICEDGLCFQFYFRNDPENIEYTKTILSPLHYSVIPLFDSLEDYHHVCGMENLHNSVTFCNREWNHKRKLKVHGVTRKDMREISGCVDKEGQKSQNKQLEVRGTTKEEIMKGDPKCPNLIAIF